jgi:hypothetical protein
VKPGELNCAMYNALSRYYYGTGAHFGADPREDAKRVLAEPWIMATAKADIPLYGIGPKWLRGIREWAERVVAQ